MKKITLFAAMLVAGMATAQVQLQQSNVKVQDYELKSIDVEKTIDREKFTAESYANRFAKKANAANATYGAVDYYSTPGMMHGGVTPEGSLFIPLIMLPYQDTHVWNNQVMELPAASWIIADAPTTWTLNGETLAENSLTCETELGLLAMAPTIKTEDHTVQVNGENVEVKGYQYGSGQASQYIITACGPDMLADGNVPLTLCGMYCDPIMDDGSDRDWYVVGAGSYGDYSIGTGLNLNGKSMDTIGSIVRNISPLKVDQIDVMLCDKTNQGGSYMFPEGASVKVEIFAADLEAGEIDMTEPLYVTTATLEDYIEFNVQLGLLSVKFYEEDIFGGLMQVPVILEGDFYVQFTNFNESGCRFGFMSDYFTPGGTTLYTWDGELTTLWTDGGANMLINYNGYWPAVINGVETNEMEVPVEGGDVACGGYLGLSLYTNVMDIDAWDVETPDWVEATINGDYLAEYNAVVIEMTAEALTEGTGRQDVVTVIADGRRVEFTLTQGEVPTGVENVVAPSFDGKTYNLLGVEVDENYKGVVIKTGPKFIQ